MTENENGMNGYGIVGLVEAFFREGWLEGGIAGELLAQAETWNGDDLWKRFDKIANQAVKELFLPLGPLFNKTFEAGLLRVASDDWEGWWSDNAWELLTVLTDKVTDGCDLLSLPDRLAARIPTVSQTDIEDFVSDIDDDFFYAFEAEPGIGADFVAVFEGMSGLNSCCSAEYVPALIVGLLRLRQGARGETDQTQAAQFAIGLVKQILAVSEEAQLAR
jgi:hypothetical protein